MAGDKQHKQANQQLAPFHLAGEKHKGQRHQRDHPGVDSQHDPDLRCFHMETLSNIGKQPYGHKFCGIKDKRSNGKRDHT
ncbi:hypothetical protein D3C86_2111630 [compost metagenome]